MMFFALAVFAVVLFVFAVDLVHRTPAALAGGILLVMAGAIGQEEAIEAVHWETLGLLFPRVADGLETPPLRYRWVGPTPLVFAAAGSADAPGNARRYRMKC